jgi:hypothetical protein
MDRQDSQPETDDESTLSVKLTEHQDVLLKGFKAS